MIILFSFTAFANEIIKQKAIRGYKFFEDGKQINEKSITGVVKQYYNKKENKVQAIYNYTNGKLDGLQKEFYENNLIHFEYTMKNGMKDGLGREFDTQEKLVYERNLVNGNGTGTEFYYDKVKKRIRKYENGIMVAISKPNYDLEGKHFHRDEKSMLIEAKGYIQDKWFYHAVKAFEDFYYKYQDSKKAPEAYFLIGYTYNNHIQDYTQAKKYYSEFLKVFPEHELASSAKFELKTLGKPIEEVTNFDK